MQFMIRAYDGQDMLEKRLAVRPRHLENMAKLPGRVICAGGLLDEKGNMKGSLYPSGTTGRRTTNGIIPLNVSGCGKDFTAAAIR